MTGASGAGRRPSRERTVRRPGGAACASVVVPAPTPVPARASISASILTPTLALLATLVSIGVLCVAASGAARADEIAEAADDEEQPGLFGRMGRSIEGTQKRASDGFTDFISSVDGFLGDGTESSGSNESRVRIRLEASRPGGEDLGFDASVKLRIVLPQSEQRFRLLFSSDDDEEGSVVSEEGTIRPPRAESSADRNASVAVRFIRTARETSSVNLDLGLRQRDGLVQVFGRLNTVAEGEMVRRWTGRVANSFFYYRKSGYENRLRFDVSRPVARRGNVFFRTNTAFNWRRGIKGANVGQTIGLYADLGERTAVALEALAGYSTAIIEGRPRYSGAEVRVRFRRNAWRPWLFYEIWPSVAWPSSTDYERAYGGLFRLEVILGQPRG